jgi:hypothetical protein
MPPTPGGMLDQLTNIIADPALTILIHLAQSPMPDNSAPVDLTTLVECNFPGYAPVAWQSDPNSQVDDDNYGEQWSTPAVWVAGAIVAPQIATCLYITSFKTGGAPQLMGPPTVFGTPYTFDTPGQTFTQTPVLGLLQDLPL